MIHSLINLVFIIGTLSSLASAVVKTEDLGILNFKKGLVGRLYQSTLTGSETFSERIDYLQKMQYLTDGELLQQRVITNFNSYRVKYKTNQMLSSYAYLDVLARAATDGYSFSNEYIQTYEADYSIYSTITS